MKLSFSFSFPETHTPESNIQGVPKKENESITPLFIGRF
jgi:hypothetical protein